tara:strand:+ start:2444 stop:3778 length:1335 start_codon:yes stop_codon:yes gene_type:complete
MTSRYVEIRPDNIPSDGRVSFKNGFPVLSFTIAAQNGVLDPRSIRICGDLRLYKDNASPPTPVLAGDDPKVMMDNRLGVFALWDQLIIRNGRSKMICESIRNYNRYMSSYLGVSSSKQDLMGHLETTCLIMPNRDTFFTATCANNTDGTQVKPFSCHLPCGFLSGGHSVNLMPTAFGALEIEIHLAPDSNVLFADTGVTGTLGGAHYELRDVKLTCEVQDIPADQMVAMSQMTEGSMEYNSITSLYTSINTANAQLQYNLALKQVQSAFVTFCPSTHINTLGENGLATTYPAKQSGANTLAVLNRIQFLRGGVKYPMDFDVTTNNSTDSLTSVSDPQVVKQFVESIIPEYQLDRSSASFGNINRQYNMGNTDVANNYTRVPDGGALFGVGVRYSQHDSGQDFSSQQWGLSIESDIAGDSPQSVFIYIKSKQTLLWSQSGVQILA